MKNLFTAIILCLTAFVLALVLFPIAFILTVIDSFSKGKGIRYLSRVFYKVAYSIDQLGNVVCGSMFNVFLIKPLSINKFGNPDETISSVLGKNYIAGELTKAGRLLSTLLDFIDENHVVKSIEQTDN